MQIATNINQPIDAVRPFPRLSASSPMLPGAPLGNITQIGSSSRSDYRALWFSLRGRVSGGLQLLGSYTLSKSTDYNSLTTQGVVAQGGELGLQRIDLGDAAQHLLDPAVVAGAENFPQVEHAKSGKGGFELSKAARTAPVKSLRLLGIPRSQARCVT